jgi:hypothetical protein
MHNENENETETETDGASVFCTLCTFSAFVLEYALAKRYRVTPTPMIEPPLPKKCTILFSRWLKRFDLSAKRIEQASKVPL